MKLRKGETDERILASTPSNLSKLQLMQAGSSRDVYGSTAVHRRHAMSAEHSSS